jgi:hypothetical protein
MRNSVHGARPIRVLLSMDRVAPREGLPTTDRHIDVFRLELE